MSAKQKRQMYGDLDAAAKSSMAEFDDQLSGSLPLDLAMAQSNAEFNDQLQGDLAKYSDRLAFETQAGQQARINARDFNDSLAASIEANARMPQVDFGDSAIEQVWRQGIEDLKVPSYELTGADAFDRMLMRSLVSSGPRVSGIVPLSQVSSLPNTVSTIEGMPSRGNYQIVANLAAANGQVSGTPSYYSAYNTLTGTTDYVIGQGDLPQFLKSTAAYETMAYAERAPGYMQESWAFVDSAIGGDAAGALGHFGSSYLEAVQDPGWLLEMGASVVGGSLSKATALRAATRERVLANIVESQTAREASQFEIHLARTDQILWGYAADEWGLATLPAGSRVFGGLPGQSAYYTSASTFEASGGSRTSLFQSLQVREHPEFGYRPKVGEYEVLRTMRMPSGIVRANPAFGPGMGDQFFIRDYESSLRLIREIPLNP